MKKVRRLDEALILEGNARDRNEAFVIVTEGRVFVNGQKAVSPAQWVTDNDKIEARGVREYAGRGAYKLDEALRKFAIDVHEKVCADIGSAVGGFVEVLLKNGAKKVYAIDTAFGKLDVKLRNDSRVVVMEETDIRSLEALPEPIDLITIDVSLIPLREILPKVKKFLARGAEIVALFKPQYETRDQSILRHGVVKDSAAREALLNDFIAWAESNRWRVLGNIESPIKGSEGNVEYLIHFESIYG